MSRHHQALNRWKLSAARKQRLTIAAERNEPCVICGNPIDYTLDGRTRWGPTVEHLDAFALGCPNPYDPRRMAPAHGTCNKSAGARLGNYLRNVTALRM